MAVRREINWVLAKAYVAACVKLPFVVLAYCPLLLHAENVR